MSVSVQIRKLRGTKSQKEFAEKIGVTQGYVSEMESGKKEPSKKLIRKLSELYGVSKGDFI